MSVPPETRQATATLPRKAGASDGLLPEVTPSDSQEPDSEAEVEPIGRLVNMRTSSFSRRAATYTLAFPRPVPTTVAAGSSRWNRSVPRSASSPL